jgi:hypothetical protein
MGTTYSVVIDMSTRGSMAPGMKQLHGTMVQNDHAAQQLMRSLQSMGSRVMRPLDMVASKMFDIGSAAVKVGMTGAFALATMGVVKYNNELEKTKIQLGAIFTASGVSGSIYKGLDMAGSVMQQMRKDAASLPGEFGDLMNIFATISTSGFKAGASTDELRSLSAKTMATGAVVGLPMDQVAREMAMLIEGRAGADNVFGMRVAGLGGDAAAQFNKLKPDERLKRISSELERFAPAIEIYKTSFEGMSSTMIDNAKSLLAKTTEPLFNRVKSSLMSINEWFDTNDNYLKTKADAIGSKLAAAFDAGKQALQEWWPAIETFGKNAYSKLVEVWKELGPTISTAGEALKSFLKDPGSVDKIITVLKLYAGAKIGGAAIGGGVGFAGDALSAVGSGAQMLGAAKTMGWIGEGATAAGALSKLGAAAASAAMPLLAFAAMVAGLAMAYDQGSKLFAEMKSDAPLNAMAAFEFGERMVRDFGGELKTGTREWADFQSVVQKNIENGDAVSASANLAGEAFGSVTSAAYAAAAALGAIGGRGGDVGTVARAAQMGNDAAASALSSMTMMTMGAVAERMADGTVGKAKGGAPKHGGGGGGTTVQKVEIVVTSNQDPSRVARMVMSEIQNLQRHPRVSRGVPNYSGAARS